MLSNCILLIDDDGPTNYLNEIILRKSNYTGEILTVTSAEKALTMLREKKCENTQVPDLIFLDINMPGMNGWEFVSEYLKLDPSCHSRNGIVMLTASQNPEDYEKAQNVDEILEYFYKPLSVEMVSDLINQGKI